MYMNFWNSQSFLENMINENKDNSELVKELLLVYKCLIEKQSDIEVQFLKSDSENRKDLEKNFTERHASNNDYHKNRDNLNSEKNYLV